MSFNMGFIGIQEDSAAGAGSAVLDMLLKFGLLKYNDNKTWGRLLLTSILEGSLITRNFPCIHL